MGIVRKRNTHGEWMYYIRYTVPGLFTPTGKSKRKWELVGPSRKAAQLADAKRKTQIREGRFWDTSEALTWPYRQLLDRYLEHSRLTKAPGTARLDENVIKHIDAALGGVLIRDLSVARALNYLEGLLARGLAPSTVVYRCVLMRRVLQKAVDWGLLREQEHSLAKLRVPVKADKGRERFFTTEELERIQTAAQASRSIFWRRLFLFALHTGMRKTEMLTLRKEYLHLDQGFLLVPPKNTKTKKVGLRHLNETACAVIREILTEHESFGFETPWLFYNPQTDTHFRPHSHRGWDTIIRKAGISNAHFHDIRHTTASHLIMSGASLKDVQEVLGHTDIKSTLRYAHLSHDHLQGVVHKLVGKLKA